MAKNAFYTQISDGVKAAIEEQIEHLKTVSDADWCSDDKAKRFRTMHEGAKTVLSILESDGICGSGTTNWLKQMSHDQLQFANEESTRLLKEKDNESRVKLWNVYSEHSFNHFFKTFDEAAEKLKEIVNNDMSKRAGKKNNLVIQPQFIRESEVEEYLK